MDAEEIFHQAIEIPDPVQRAQYLDQACAGDEKLRGEVDALLNWYDEAADFLETPALAAEASVGGPAVTEGPGTVIGRYKLLEKIGEGGMAVVYMAEQEQPIRRRVALKIIKLGMDTKQVIARFEAERQALALMDHPSIAKVLDAGATETGRPYFVMELVQGLSITEYCDRNHLSTKERLALFLQVCQAVQHAHQKGIIHRDIKPSNVMVAHLDGEPLPKVIDFGIAKAINQKLTEKTLFTRYAHIIGTPAYMSPEQAQLSDLDIDTRSDIYSLGVLLYELLTGTTPFSEEELRKAGYLEMQRVIREQEPVKPSTKLTALGQTLPEVAQRRGCSPDLLHKAIRGDLDWIVMKSLEKDRRRRYVAISSLLEDIERHLHDEPVLAGPPGVWYRTAKFVRRHRMPLAAALAIAGLIVIGLVVSTALYLRAERARAETDLVSDFFAHDLLASLYPEKAKDQAVTVRYILDSAVKDIDKRLQGSPLAEARVRETIGLAYQKLGDYQAAEPHLQRAWQIRCEQLGQDDPATLVCLSELGRVYMLAGQYAEAQTTLEDVLARRLRVLGEEHPDTLETMCNLGELHVYRARFGDADPLLAKVVQIGSRVLGEQHPIVIEGMLGLANVYVYSFQHARADPLARKGFEISRRVLGDEHETTLGFMSTLVCICREQKRYEEGKALSARALEIGRRVYGEEHPATLEAMSQLGDLYIIEGRYDEAAPLVTKAVELGRRVLGPEHVWTLYFTMRLIRLYEARHQYEELEATAMEALEIGRRTFGNIMLTGYFKGKLQARASALGLAAKGHYDAGQFDEAVRALVRQAQLHKAFASRNPESPPADVALLAMSLYRAGRAGEAAAELQRLRAMFEQGDYTYEERCLAETEQVFAGPGSQTHQAWGLLAGGKLKEASGIIERLQMSLGDNDPNGDIRSLTNALGRAYCLGGAKAEGRGEYEQAMADYESSLQSDPGSAHAHERLARLLSTCHRDHVRDGARAVEHARAACKLTEWKNAACLATLAAAYAEAGDFRSAVQSQSRAIELLAPDDRQGFRQRYEMRLRQYEARKPYHRSLVARWAFEQSRGRLVLDSSGNGLHGRLVGHAHTVADADRPGRVLCLDGDGDWVDCGNGVRLNIVAEITIACWVRVRKFDKPRQTILSKGNSAWRLARVGANAVEFGCNGLALPDGISGALPGTANVNDGRWHHVAGVYDGTRICLYVDGRLDASSEASGRFNMESDKVLIGENDGTSQRSFDGFLDDVRIYDYALSAAEIQTLFSNPQSKGVKR